MKNSLENKTKLISPFTETLLKEFRKMAYRNYKNNALTIDESLSNKINQFFISLLDEKIHDLTSQTNIKNKKIVELAKNLQIEPFSADLTALLSHLFNENSLENDKNIAVENILNSVQNHISQKTSWLDSRKYKEEDRIVRRMDALARLLKSKDLVSACTAVVLFNNICYISMNNSGKDFNLEKQVLKMKKALNYLIHFHSMKESSTHMDYESFLKNAAEEAIKNHFHNDLPLKILTQDLAKLIDSLHFNPEEFVDLQSLLSEDLQLVFLYPDKNDTLQYVVYNDTTKSNLTISIPATSHMHVSKHSIHAEQILIHYLMNHQNVNEEQPIRLGVTKLCCGTCDDFLSNYPQVKVRGTHAITYQNAYNLYSEEISKGDGISNPRPVHPEQSPPSTPIKKLRGKENNHRFANIAESSHTFFNQLENEHWQPSSTIRKLQF